MAKKEETSAKPVTLKDKLLSLTWNELRAWSDARTVERGRGYLSNVDEPVMFDDGSLVSVVHGGDDYFTRLRLDAEGGLQSECSCPVGYRCKHAVALALACAKLFQEGKEIEKADMDSSDPNYWSFSEWMAGNMALERTSTEAFTSLIEAQYTTSEKHYYEQKCKEKHHITDTRYLLILHMLPALQKAQAACRITKQYVLIGDFRDLNIII